MNFYSRLKYIYYIRFKVFFHIPLPLENHFYKWKRISIRKKWFCIACLNTFDLKPWSKYKDKPFSQIKCPNCNSDQIAWDDYLFRAIVDKKSNEEIIDIMKERNINYQSVKLDAQLTDNLSVKIIIEKHKTNESD